MVVSLCLNPAFDLSIYIDDFQYENTNLFSRKQISAGGKAINFANMLACLRHENVCLNLISNQDVKKFYDILEKRHKLSYSNILYEGSLRTNIKIIEKDNTLTEINEISNVGNEYILESIIEEIECYLSENDILVLSGSVPNGFGKDIYNIIAKRFKNNRIVIDSSYDYLKLALNNKLYCIKPNRSEFEYLVGKKFNNLNEYIKAGKEFYDSINCEYMLLSLAEDGALLFNKSNIYYANSLSILENKSTVGGGDAMLAGFISSVLNNNSNEEHLKHAVASATAYINNRHWRVDTYNKHCDYLSDIVVKNKTLE